MSQIRSAKARDLWAVANVSGKRELPDLRSAFVSRDEAEGAVGYLVRYGISPYKLYNHYLVYGNSVEIRTLNVDSDYFFRVDSFNSSKITESVLCK